MSSELENLRIGWAQTNITPDRPVLLSGQLYSRVSHYVHDPVTATALVLDNGSEQAILVSCDMVGIDDQLIASLRRRLDGKAGITVAKISVNATHTHNNSRFVFDTHREAFERILGADILPAIDAPDNILMNNEATEFWTARIAALVLDAWQSRQPGGIGFAHDYAAVGFNRRPVFRQPDGQETSKMYGCCASASFLRFEGPVDHAADMMYTFNLTGELTGVMVDIPCPSQVMELHYFISADYWTPARARIREALGRNIPVLALCGAAGDQNPIDLIQVSKDNEAELADWNAQASEVWCNYDLWATCEATGQRIADAVRRGYTQARNDIRQRVDFQHRIVNLELPIRQVTEAEYREACRQVDFVKQDFNQDARMGNAEQVKLFEPVGIIKRWLLQQKCSVYSLESHIIRIGDAVLATNPFELFVEYGLRIRARSEARYNFIVQLSNGVGGYLPTDAAIAGGSYSSKPASTTVGPREGDLLVEKTLSVIRDLWSS